MHEKCFVQTKNYSNKLPVMKEGFTFNSNFQENLLSKIFVVGGGGSEQKRSISNT